MDSAQWNKCEIPPSTAADPEKHNLLKKLQLLQEAILQKNDPAQITALIKKLKYQAVLYFSQKEKWLLTNQNKAYHQHRQVHDQFIWKVTDLQSEYSSRRHPQALALCTELQEWISDTRSSLTNENGGKSFSIIDHDPSISY